MNQGNMSPISSTSVLGSNLVYNSRSQSESGSSGQVHLLSSLIPNLPERPDQPECRYFMSTGSCKYGSDCKYHHPKERIAQLASNTLGPLGLPLRPVSSFTFLCFSCRLVKHFSEDNLEAWDCLRISWLANEVYKINWTKLSVNKCVLCVCVFIFICSCLGFVV